MLRQFLTLGLAPLLLGTLWAGADDARDQYRRLEQAYLAELTDFVQTLRDAGETEFAASVAADHLDRDPGRQYFYLPSSSQQHRTAARPRDPAWLIRYEGIRQRCAGQLFSLVDAASQAGAEALAFSCLHEICCLDPNHETARRLLGFRLVDGQWVQRVPAIDSRVARSRHSFLPWTGGEYRVVKSANYEIASTAGESETLQLAERLENARMVWQQAFFDYWSTPGRLRERLVAGEPIENNNRRMQVVLFKDRGQYTQLLGQLGVTGVERSTGYYNDRHRVMFFYIDDPLPIDTWLQEQAHQLFQESTTARKDPVENSHIWVLEGLGTYFESLLVDGEICSLGGFDARRLQFARIRLFREGFFCPIEQLTQYTRQSFQQDPNVTKLYSEAAGLTHFLMDYQSGRYRPALMQLARLVYTRKAELNSLETLCQTSNEALEADYKSWLPVTCDQFKSYLTRPGERTELALGFGNLDDSAADQLAQCISLQWLQLSSTQVGDPIGAAVQRMAGLRQLFLDRCHVTDEILGHLASLQNLEELDLTGTQISDDGLAVIAQFSRLKYLWLGSTQISDRGIEQLAALRQLEFLDTSNTRVSDAGRQRLKQKSPNLQ